MRAWLLALTACGRIDFAPVDDAAIDVFGDARPLANVNSSSREFGASISLDERELYFTSNRSTDFLIYVATRSTPEVDFDPPVLAEFDGTSLAGEPGLARDGVEQELTISGVGVRHIARSDAASPWLGGVAEPRFATFGGAAFGGHDLRLVMQGDTDDQLYEATRATTTSPWSPPNLIAELAGRIAHQNYPAMTDDGLDLFYQAYADPTGIATILVAHRPALDRPFGEPHAALVVPAGVSVGDPGISADGRTLYYSSDESGGGSEDLWVANLVE